MKERLQWGVSIVELVEDMRCNHGLTKNPEVEAAVLFLY